MNRYAIWIYNHLGFSSLNEIIAKLFTGMIYVKTEINNEWPNYKSEEVVYVKVSETSNKEINKYLELMTDNLTFADAKNPELSKMNYRIIIFNSLYNLKSYFTGKKQPNIANVFKKRVFSIKYNGKISR